MSELVAITGGAGFIGSHLAEGFLRSGYAVRVIDNLSAGNLANLATIEDKIEFLRIDIRDSDSLVKAFQGVSTVLHHAALVSPVHSFNDPGTTHSVNVTGTHTLLLAAAATGVRRVIIASSSAVYGDNGTYSHRETVAPCPVSPYGFSKWINEVCASQFVKTTGLEVVSLRYFNVFGPRQCANTNYAAVIPTFIYKLLHRLRPVIFGDGTQTRDFTFVGNIVQANVRAAIASLPSGATLNIATGKKFSINDLVSHLNEILGTTISPSYAAKRDGDIEHSCADITESEKALGNYNEVPFREGLAETVQWFSRSMETHRSSPLRVT